MAQDVFISYSHNDVLYAEAVCKGLEKRGLKCWMAPRDIPAGDNFAAAIVNGLNGARAFLLIFSSSSNRSEHVAKEVNLATGKPIFYLRTEDLKPTPPLQYFLSDIQWMDAFGHPDDAILDRLAAVIKTAILHRPPRNPTTIPGSMPGGRAAVNPPAVVQPTPVLTSLPAEPPLETPAEIYDPFALPPAAPRRLPWLWIGLAALLVVVIIGAIFILGKTTDKGSKGGDKISPTATVDRLTSAHVTLINSLDVGLSLHITGQGREYSYNLGPGEKMDVYVLAGSYHYLMEAEGFNALSGEKSWDSGDWEWEFYAEGYTPTP
jgi:hypothetical protein